MALTQISTQGIKDGTITNADINASAAIAGTKISPDFGSQNIITTGNINIGAGTGRLDSNGIIKTAHGTESAPSHTFINDTDNGMFRVTTNTIGFATGGSERMRIDSSGNVGINTTSMAGKLNVQGSAGGVALQTTDATNSTFRISHPSAAVTLLSGGSSQHLALGTGFAEKMRIDSSGRVGIGTSSPSTPLHVSTNTDGTSDLLTLHADADGTNFGIASIKFTGNTGNHAAFIKGGHTTNGDSILTFHTDAHDSGINPQERMRITSDGPHLLLGGTSDVNEITETSANAGMVIGGTGFGNAGLAIITSTSGTGRLYFGDAVANAAGRNRGQINYGHSDDHMRFVTAGTERMRIDSEGRVAISSTGTYFDTNTMLEVVGKTGAGPNLVLHRNDTTVSTNQVLGALRVTGNDNDGSTQQEAAAIEFAADGNHANNDKPGRIAFRTTADGGSSGTERMRIDSSGNMLLGLTSTSFPKRLNVQGSSGAIIALKNNDTTSYAANTNTSIEFGLNTGNTGNQNGACEIRAFKENGTNGNNARGLSFYTGTNGGSPTERMRIASNGNALFHTTTNDNTIAGAGGIQLSDDANGSFIRISKKTTQAVPAMEFYNANGRVGQIIPSGTSTSFTTHGSDRSLKKNFESWSEDVLALFKNINPQKFNFIQEEDGTEKTKGFIAQEIADSFPEAYIKSFGEDEKYFFNPSGMVVYLMKAIQELEAEVAALKAS